MTHKVHVAQVLREAAARVEQGWCQGKLAVTERGFGDVPHSEYACAWCLVGSVYATRQFHVYSDAIAAVERIVGGQASEWNDAPERTQAEVVAALRQAADAVEADASCG